MPGSRPSISPSSTRPRTVGATPAHLRRRDFPRSAPDRPAPRCWRRRSRSTVRLSPCSISATRQTLPVRLGPERRGIDPSITPGFAAAVSACSSCVIASSRSRPPSAIDRGGGDHRVGMRFGEIVALAISISWSTIHEFVFAASAPAAAARRTLLMIVVRPSRSRPRPGQDAARRLHARCRPHRRPTNIVFPCDGALFPHMNVFEQHRLPPEAAARPKARSRGPRSSRFLPWCVSTSRPPLRFGADAAVQVSASLWPALPPTPPCCCSTIRFPPSLKLRQSDAARASVGSSASSAPPSCSSPRPDRGAAMSDASRS